MTGKEETYACIDVAGSKRSLDVAWVNIEDRIVRHCQLGNVAEVANWVNTHHPNVLAIDAPSKRNGGRTQDPAVREQYGIKPGVYVNFRLCEALSVKKGLQAYPTPLKSPEGWIVTGFEIYEKLARDPGYRIWDQPGPVRVTEPTLVEVFPHACFVVGLGWLPRKKDMLTGQLERVSYLLDEGKVDGRPLEGPAWPDRSYFDHYFDFSERASRKLESLPVFTHDVIDCLGGLLTAISCRDGTAFALGEPEEGVIVLPKEPIEGKYKKPTYDVVQ